MQNYLKFWLKLIKLQGKMMVLILDLLNSN
jgi:hypothetical protein